MRQEPISTSFDSVSSGVVSNRFYADGLDNVRYPIELLKRTLVTKTPSWTVNYKSAKKAKIRLRALYYKHKRTESYPSRGMSAGYYYDWSSNAQAYVWYPAWSKVGLVGMTLLPGTTEFDIVVRDQLISLEQQADKMARLKLLLQAKDSKANLVQAYAESDQLKRLIGDFAHTLGGAIVDLRLGRLRSAGARFGLTISKRKATRYSKLHKNAKSEAKIDEMLAQGVLSIQYGIRPLISDVIGTAELYAQKVVEEVVNLVKSKGNFEASPTVTLTESSRRMVQTSSVELQVTVRYGATFAKGSETRHTLAQLGISNPLLIAWELMPWSFVIDWLLPVGNWISSLDATQGLDFVDGYRSVRIRSNRSDTQTWSDPMDKNAGAYGDGFCRSQYVVDSFERSVLTDWPSSSFPSFKNPVSWEHALNAVALLIGVKKNIYR